MTSKQMFQSLVSEKRIIKTFSYLTITKYLAFERMMVSVQWLLPTSALARLETSSFTSTFYTFLPTWLYFFIFFPLVTHAHFTFFSHTSPLWKVSCLLGVYSHSAELSTLSILKPSLIFHLTTVCLFTDNESTTTLFELLFDHNLE